MKSLIKRRRGQPRISIADFLEDGCFRVDTYGCWIWLGSTRPKSNGTKYGAIKFSGKLRYAHRIFLHLATGVSLDDSRETLHSCDNSLCVNPQHLSLGTHRENTHDAINKGRFHFVKNRYLMARGS